MSIDYFEDLEYFEFPVCDPEDPGAAREAIIVTLVDLGIEVPEPQTSADELAGQAPHLLFGWQYDHDLSLALYAIPVGKLSEELAAAMKFVDGLAYAYQELTIGDDASQAFVRIDAAMGLELDESYFEQFPNTIDDGDVDCLGEYRVAYLEDGEEPQLEAGAFDKRYIAAYSVRRAQ